MEYKKLKERMAQIDECNRILESSWLQYSTPMKICLKGAVLERRQNIINQMKHEGVTIDVTA